LGGGELPTLYAGEAPELTAEMRETLTRPVRHAWFFGLERLSDDDALLLSRVPGFVSVGSIKSLSVRSAEYFRRQRGVLSFGHVCEISDEVASALAGHRGMLSLDRLSHVSDRGLELLSRNEGMLILGLEHITPDQARILARARHGLSLPRIGRLSEESAAILATLPGELDINLTEISAGVARQLAKRRDLLRFGDRSIRPQLRLTVAAARELARYRGRLSFRLLFDGPPEEVLAALAPHAGELYLNLEQQPLTPAMARALSVHRGDLSIDCQMPISREAAAALARHDAALDLSGCDYLSADAILALAGPSRTDLRVRLSEPLNEALARALAKYRGRLSLGMSREHGRAASSAGIIALAAHRGRLWIPSAFVRIGTVVALSKHQGGLHVYDDGDTGALDADVAGTLAAIDGWLRVDGPLSTEALRALATHRGDLVLNPLPQGHEAVEALQGRGDGELFFPFDSAVHSTQAAVLIASDAVGSSVNGTSCLLSDDAVEIASALARKHGPLSFPRLEYVTADALRALVTKEDVELMPLDHIYVFDGNWCVVPASSVVSEAFLEFNRRHQPPRSLSIDQQFYDN
jgi:hypothetical protein